jgi:hypothetical protein
MSDVEKLHDRARRYLVERLESLRSPGPVEYRGQRAFVVEEMLREVERFVPHDFDSLSEARELLVECARVAAATLGQSKIVREDVLAAEAAERELFVRFLSEVDVSGLQSEPMRPYRRTLSDGEQAAWMSKLADRWGVRTRLYPWYPLIEGPIPADVVVVTGDYWANAIVDPGRASELLQGVSSGHIIELRTDMGVGYESDDTLVQLFYGWELEGLFTDASLDWLIYASHEDTVALGGVHLVASLDRIAPDWRSNEWNGWGA